MFCSRCTEKLHDGAMFCHECGTPVTGKESPENMSNIRVLFGNLTFSNVATGHHSHNIINTDSRKVKDADLPVASNPLRKVNYSGSCEEQSRLDGGETKNIMISYNWDNQELVFWIKEQLEGYGYTVWIDTKNVQRRLRTDIAKGVNGAQVVLICMSQRYRNSEFCREEAEYAARFVARKEKIIIPLKMEEMDETNDWLDHLVAGYKYYDFSGKYSSENKMQELLEALAEWFGKKSTDPQTNVLDDVKLQSEKSSMLSRSSDHENEDVKLIYEDLTRLKEIISAGPDNKEAVDIVDTIKKEDDRRLKTEVFQYLAELLRCKIISREKRAKFRIWPGMTILPDDKIKFVCLYKGKLETQLPSFFGIDIHYKDMDIPEPLIDLDDHEKLNWEMTTDLDASLLQSAIEQHGDTLFKQHSNLQVICGGPFSIRNRCVVKQCTIILYCHAKGIIPYGEETFPSSLNFNGINIPVDIREGHFMLAVGRQEWHKSLCMGISIGEKGVVRAGTLGPFVGLGHNEYGFLTCAHVVGDVGEEVVQPSKGDSRGQKTEEETICGTVEKSVFEPDFCNRMNGLTKTGVDAALVKLNKDRGIEATNFAEVQEADLDPIGFTPETKFHYVGGGIGCPRESRKARGKIVIKYGRTTGLSRGVMVLEGAMVKIDDIEQYYEKWNTTFILKGQYLVDGIARYQFAAPGDSGAGVFTLDDENRLTLIGLVAGGLDARFDHRCVVTPIEHILTALELNPDDLIFHEKIEIDQQET